MSSLKVVLKRFNHTSIFFLSISYLTDYIYQGYKYDTLESEFRFFQIKCLNKYFFGVLLLVNVDSRSIVWFEFQGRKSLSFPILLISSSYALEKFLQIVS
jgi:hypothetical protein